MPAQLHLAIDAFTLQLLLERPQRLVDIVIAHNDLHEPVVLQSRFRAVPVGSASGMPMRNGQNAMRRDERSRRSCRATTSQCISFQDPARNLARELRAGRGLTASL